MKNNGACYFSHLFASMDIIWAKQPNKYSGLCLLGF